MTNQTTPFALKKMLKFYAWSFLGCVFFAVVAMSAANEIDREAALERAAFVEKTCAVAHDVQYELITKRSIRHDGAASYFALIDSWKSYDDYRETVRSVIFDIACKAKTNKFSLDVYDDRDIATKRSSESLVERLSLDDAIADKHLIAIYNGALETSPTYFDLSWFPGVITDRELVKQVETEHYDPLPGLIKRPIADSASTTANAPDFSRKPGVCEVYRPVSRTMIEYAAKFPEDARIPSCSEFTLKNLYGNEYELKGYIIAPNAFGVEDHINFTLRMTYKGNSPSDMANWDFQDPSIY